MNSIRTPRVLLSRISLCLAVLAVALLAQAPSRAAKILFVINTVIDPVTPANENDFEVLDRLTGQGHTVTLVEDDSVSAADVSGQDLVLISSSSSSSAAGVNALSKGPLRTGLTPVVCYEPALYDELLWQTADTYGNAGGHTSLAIIPANQGHPLAAGKSGTVEIVAPGDSATVSSSAVPLSLGSEAILIATNATPDVDVGRAAIWAYDHGARLADDATVTAGRKVALFYNASTPFGVYNSDATDLFDAAIKWALVPPSVFPITIAARSPEPDATGVPLDASITAELEDGTRKVSESSIALSVDGAALTPTVTRSGSRTKVTAKPAASFPPSSVISVVLVYSDDGSPPNSFTNTWQFTTLRPPSTSPAFRQMADGLVAIETENFYAIESTETHRWEFAATPAGFSGDGAMYALPDSGATTGLPDALTGSPRLDYKINFSKTGTHYLWVRGSDGGGDSVHAGLDDEDPTGSTLDNIDSPDCCGDRAAGGVSLVWINGIDAGPENRAVFEVPSAGDHTLHLWMREDGMIVDKVVITTDPDFTPTGAGPDESRHVGDPVKPVVTLTGPTDGATFAKGADVTVTATASDADGTVAKVEFFEGANKIGEDTSAPYSIVWKPSGERPYTLSATATDNTGDTATSASVKIVVGNPPKVLFIGDDPLTRPGDLVIINHLESRGFLVTAVDDDDSDTPQADGMSLVVISSTVSSGDVNVKFTDVAVPVINWEEALLDDLNLTGDSGADPDHHGTTGSQTALEITKADHPLAAGLAAGANAVFTSPRTVSWGFPEANSANAIQIATVPGNANQVAIFAYEKGATLFDGFTPAPARRVGFFLNGDSPTALNEPGLRLVDAAINWALNITVVEPPKLAITRSAGQITISWSNGGTLQQADAITGPWTDATSQGNPQNVATTGTAKFYRVRR